MRPPAPREEINPLGEPGGETRWLATMLSLTVISLNGEIPGCDQVVKLIMSGCQCDRVFTPF